MSDWISNDAIENNKQAILNTSCENILKCVLLVLIVISFNIPLSHVKYCLLVITTDNIINSHKWASRKTGDYN